MAALSRLGFLYCSRDLDEEAPSHVWLEYEGIISDLTADQFGIIYPPTIVGYIGTRSIIMPIGGTFLIWPLKLAIEE